MDALSLQVKVEGITLLGEKHNGIGKESKKPYFILNMDVVGSSLPFFVEEKTFNQLTKGAYYKITNSLVSRNGDLHLRNPTFEEVELKK